MAKTGMTIELMQYRTNEGGTKTALVAPVLRKWRQILMMEDGPLKVRRVLSDEQRYMTPLERNGKPYPISRAIRVFRDHARTHGISRTARHFLTEASQ